MKRFSLKTLLLVALVFMLKGPMAYADEAPDLETLIGIPVMAGLVEDLDQRLVFDKSEGRIIHVVLRGDASFESAFAFYQEVLFQLGWEHKEAPVAQRLIFSRDQEYLTVSFMQTEPLELVFDLKPSS